MAGARGHRTQFDSAENAAGEVIALRDVVFVCAGRRARIGHAGYVQGLRRERSAGPVLVTLSFDEARASETYTLDQLSFEPPVLGGWRRGGHLPYRGRPRHGRAASPVSRGRRYSD